MSVGYHTRRGIQVPDYQCMRECIEGAASRCQQIPGAGVDKAIGQLLLDTLTPLTLEVALNVQTELENRADQADQLRATRSTAPGTAPTSPAAATWPSTPTTVWSQIFLPPASVLTVASSPLTSTRLYRCPPRRPAPCGYGRSRTGAAHPSGGPDGSGHCASGASGITPSWRMSPKSSRTMRVSTSLPSVILLIDTPCTVTFLCVAGIERYSPSWVAVQA